VEGVEGEIDLMLGKHLSWYELQCKDGTPYPDKWRNNRAIQLAEVFEVIRARWNKPIKVLSAYRTPVWNKKIGGARNSQHLHGRALDLRPPRNVSVDEFYNHIKDLAMYIPAIKGIGKYKTFVHVDTRPTEKIAYWFGTGAKDDTKTS